MILAILLTAICVLLDNIDSVKYIGQDGGPSVFYFLFFSISYGGLFGHYLLPAMCAMPFATAFLEDYEHHFLVYMAGRTGKQNYLLSKYAVSILLGGITSAVGIAVLIAVLSIWCPAIADDELDPESCYLSFVTLKNGMSYYGYTLYYSFLTGCMWSGIAAAVSAFIRSRCFTLAVPFIGTFLLTQGLRTLQMPDALRLDMWLCMRWTIRSESFTMALSASMVIGILLLAGVAFMRKGGKLIENA